MSDARRLGELRDMVNAESEFEDECFSIHESIQRNVFTLRALMDSQFATAKSLHEKKRQNLFYIAETRDLQADVLELIATQLPDHLVDDEMYELARIYKQMISQHQQAWVVQLAEIWNTIQRMLFKTREVQKRNANFAKALLLFQLHPRYEGPDVPVDDTSPPWLFKVDPVPVRPNPDVLRGGTLDDMASIAATLAAGPQRVARAEDFVPQQVADDGEPSRKVVELEPELYDIALHQFLIDVQSSVDGYGLSAYLWKFNRREFDDLSMAVWLQCLLIEEDGEEMDAFRLVPVFAPQQDEVSGTRVFSDVSVTSRLVNSFAEHH
jgi:hypothetical protein